MWTAATDARATDARALNYYDTNGLRAMGYYDVPGAVGTTIADRHRVAGGSHPPPITIVVQAPKPPMQVLTRRLLGES
ncbi:MAG: hypothetical protein ACLPH3_12185 [Terracidiphilus sp.]